MTAKNREISKRGSGVDGGETAGPDEIGRVETEQPKTSAQAADERPGSVDGEAQVLSGPRPDGAGEGARSDGGDDGAAHDGRAPLLEEILGLLRVIEQRTGQQKGGSAGLTREAVDKLAKSVEELGAKGAVARALRKVLARRNGSFKRAVKEAAGLTRELRVYRRDLERWVGRDRRMRRRWAGLAILAGFPAALLLGVLVEQQFQVIPVHDPTGGWHGHVWENYGRKIVDCATEAMQTDAEVNCPLVVRRP